MPKGSYPVSGTYVGPSKDASFRSCVCAMLIVFVICGSILLIAHFAKNSGSKKHEPSHTEDSLGIADHQKGNKHDPKNTENEPLKPITTTTTKKPIKLHTTRKPEPPEQNNESKTVISLITDKIEEKPATEASLTTTVSMVKNVVPTENVIESTKNVINTQKIPVTEQNQNKNTITTEKFKDETTILSVDESKISQSTNDETQSKVTTTEKSKNVIPEQETDKSNIHVVHNVTKETDKRKEETTTEIVTTTTKTVIIDPRNKNDDDKTEQNNIVTTQQPNNPIILTTEETTTNLPIKNEEKKKIEPNNIVTTQQSNNPIILTTEETSTNPPIKNEENKKIEPNNIVTTQQSNNPIILTTEETSTNPPIKNEEKKKIEPNNIVTTQQPNNPVTILTTEETSTNPPIKNEEKKKIGPNNIVTTQQPNNPIILTTEETSTNPPIKNEEKKKIEPNNIVTTQQPNNPIILTTEETSTNPPIKNEEKKKIEPNNIVTTQQPNNPIILTTEETSTNPPIKNEEKKKIEPNNIVTTQQPNNPIILTTEETTNPPIKDDEEKKIEQNKIVTTEEPINPVTILTTLTPVPTTMKPTPRPVVHETEEVDNRRTTSLPEESKHCDAVCVKSAARILTRMRMEGDACEDFYDYACGGDYSDNTPEDHWKKIAPGIEKINDNDPNAYKIFRNFYETCVEFQFSYNISRRFEEAMNLIHRVNQLVEAEAKDNGKAALTVLLTQLLLIDSSPLFDISVDVDKTSQRFVFQLNIGKRFSTIFNNKMAKKKCLYQSKKHSEFSIRAFNYLNSTELYAYYWNCLKTSTNTDEEIEEALINFFPISDDSWISSIQNINDLYKAYTPAYIRKEVSLKNFTYKKVSELNYNYRMVNWTQLFTNLVGKEVSEESLVQVYFPDYFRKLFSLLKGIGSDREVQDVILGMFATDLNTNFVRLVPEENPEEFCLKQSVDLMPEIASSFYLDSFGEEDVLDDQKRVIDLFNAMKNKLIEQIPHTNWTDPSTKTALMKKTNAMMLETWSGSLIWKNDTLLDERMKLVNLNYSCYNDFKFVLTARKQNMTFNMWDTFAYNQENIWWYFLTPYDTKPAIIYASNLVVIPPGMLFSNSKHLPLYWSLAELGYKLGKAIGHHFDHIGSKNNISLVDTISSNSYVQSEKCTEFYYKQEKTEMIYDGRNINYKVSDDIIEVSTIERYVVQISLNLISSMLNITKDDFNVTMFSNSEFAEVFYPEKLFFIVLGQEHCRKPNLDDFILSLYESEHLPSALLLNTALIHSERFSKVFSCREGSRINQMLKCAAFPNIDVAETDTAYDY